MSNIRVAPSAEDWEKHKARIIELYESSTLDAVVRDMEASGFYAT
jgi:hypothetical protein